MMALFIWLHVSHNGLFCGLLLVQASAFDAPDIIGSTLDMQNASRSRGSCLLFSSAANMEVLC